MNKVETIVRKYIIHHDLFKKSWQIYCRPIRWSRQRGFAPYFEAVGCEP